MHDIPKERKETPASDMRKPSRFLKALFRPVSWLLVLLLTAGLLASCVKEEAEAVSPPPPMSASEGLRIAVGSDLHFNPEIKDGDEEKEAYYYNPELIDALLEDAVTEGARILLLTGDICNSGKGSRHEELAEKLRKAEEKGISIYVLPGNHDLGPAAQTDFASVYGDFGFDEAVSRDTASLSYCIMRDDVCILMMDTAGYPAGIIDLPGAPPQETTGAFLNEETLSWAEVMLKAAQEKGLYILCAGHYNLLTEDGNDPENPDYYLRNGDRFAALLRKYDVPLYLSGHLHTRLVMQEDSLTELVTEYLLSYPTSYSMLDLTEDAITYAPRRVNVDSWAEKTGQEDPALLHFSQWQQDALRAYSYENVEYMSAKNPISRGQQKKAAEFFYAVMNAYWNGELAEKREELSSMPGYKPFFRCAEGFGYGWWLKDLMDQASPLLGGFRLER